MSATKEKAKETEKKPEAKQEPKQEEKSTTKGKSEFSIRHLTEDETKTLIDDDSLPEGYANVVPKDDARAVEEEKKSKEEPEKPEPAQAEKKPELPQPEDSFAKLERELVKPEGAENLNDFSPREKAYFYQMRRDRKSRQKAEEERDRALFRESKLKEEKKPEPEKDLLEGRDEDDIVTVKEVRELLGKKLKAEVTKPVDSESNEVSQKIQVRYLQMCEKEARLSHPDDFDAVMELADELLPNNENGLREISDRTRSGENPAEVMYQVIKKHQEFQVLYPAAELRAKAKRPPEAAKEMPGTTPSAPVLTPEDKAKEEKARQAEKALEENNNRPKTTAHVSSREGKAAEELTLQEITAMSDREFSKLPRRVRQKYLDSMGVGPEDIGRT